MTPSWLGALQLMVTAAFGFALVGSVLFAAITLLTLRATAAWAPAIRHRLLCALAVAPLGLALLCTVVASLPALLAFVEPSFDHCLVHGDGHPHLCLRHLPTSAGPLALWLVLAIAAAGILTALGRSIARLRRGVVLVRNVLATGQLATDLNATIVDSALPLCLSVGLTRPQVVLSRQLVATLTPQGLHAALAHEHEHGRRRDALVLWGLTVCAALHLPRVRRRLLAEIEVESERVCDEAAANRVGDRLTVAEAILQVERLLASSDHHAEFAPVAAAFGQRAVERRVLAMLEPPTAQGSLRLPIAIACSTVVGLLLACDPVHHVTETLLAFVIP
ncbi:MAG: M56 family peptidase [Myxococcales bacterium]|nr:M56 family peptidase [Myxococcales bacterium]